MSKSLHKLANSYAGQNESPLTTERPASPGLNRILENAAKEFYLINEGDVALKALRCLSVNDALAF
jgi:hypothetical protein